MTHQLPVPRKRWNWKVAAFIGALIFGTAGLATAVGAATSGPTQVCTSPTAETDGIGLDCHIHVPVVTPTVTAPGPTTTVTVTASPTDTGTLTPTPTPTPTVTSTAPAGLSLSPAEAGGASYYGQFSSNSIPTSNSFFPIGVWDQNYCDAHDLNANYGLNILVDPVGAPTGPNNQICGPGVQNQMTPLLTLDDEVDMWGGPGSDPWTGHYPGQGTICNNGPDGGKCGYTIMQFHQSTVATDGSALQPGELRYANYGKGVEFWEDDAQAAKFVNQYQDVVSADLYWGTDSDLCQASQGGVLLGTNANLASAKCHEASNYGHTVDRIRALLTSPKPIWNFVEIGHPGSTSSAMPPAEIRAAVWSSLIHGARGIIYFDHSFGGNCISDNVLKECTQSTSALVAGINAQITSLAPALNGQRVNGVTETATLDAAARYDGSHVYVFAEPNGFNPVSGASVTVAGYGNGTATVIGENRTVPIVSGKITDSFATANTVHLYQFS